MRIEKEVIRREMETRVICDLCGKTMEMGDRDVYALELGEVTMDYLSYEQDGGRVEWDDWEHPERKEGSVRLSEVGQAFCSVCSLILIRRMAEDCKEAFSVALESAKATHGRKEVE
jgi:hypothetical protein